MDPRPGRLRELFLSLLPLWKVYCGLWDGTSVHTTPPSVTVACPCLTTAAATAGPTVTISQAPVPKLPAGERTGTLPGAEPEPTSLQPARSSETLRAGASCRCCLEGSDNSLHTQLPGPPFT